MSNSTDRRSSDAGVLRTVLRLSLLASCVKLLLIPHSPSTDFEVHRHWLSLTSSRPIPEWYTDESSQWTLDYPPLFAYYTACLSKFAPFFDSAMLDISNHNYTSPETHLFMRLTVLLSDSVLMLGAFLFLKSLSDIHPRSLPDGFLHRTAMLMLFNPGLFLVDNLHFQYNGLPLGFLLLTLAALHYQRNTLGAALLVVTIHLKHTLLPALPVILLHILFSSSISSLFQVALVAVGLTTLIWLPFLLHGTHALVPPFRRLFPFKRGLLHSYWAPNFWAFYAALDKVMAVVYRRLGLSVRTPDVDPASGLVGGLRPFSVLPNIAPWACALLTLIVIVPAALAVARNAWTLRAGRRLVDETVLTKAVGFSCLGAFVFGFHVHEKAVLFATVPLSGVAIEKKNREIAWCFVVLAVAGHYALFPLVTEAEILLYKLLHFIGYQVFMMGMTPTQHIATRMYIWSWVLVEFYSGKTGGHKLVFGSGKFDFLPLIVVALYSSTGVLSSTVIQLASTVKLLRTSRTVTKED